MKVIHWFISLPLIIQQVLKIKENIVCAYTPQQIKDIGLNYHSAPNGVTCEKCRAIIKSLKIKRGR